MPGEGDEQGKGIEREEMGRDLGRGRGRPSWKLQRQKSGGAVGHKVGVGKGRVPTGVEGSAGAQVPGVGLQESLGAGTCNEAGTKRI